MILKAPKTTIAKANATAIIRAGLPETKSKNAG
jgi:hypothetical protein